jgi:putative NADH-flavin reductase
MRVCIVGASGKLGKYMVQHALDRGYQVVGVCGKQSAGKLDAFEERISVVPGLTNDVGVIKRAVSGATACSSCLSCEACTRTHRARPRQFSTMRLRQRDSCSLAAGI